MLRLLKSEGARAQNLRTRCKYPLKKKFKNLFSNFQEFLKFLNFQNFPTSTFFCFDLAFPFYSFTLGCRLFEFTEFFFLLKVAACEGKEQQNSREEGKGNLEIWPKFNNLCGQMNERSGRLWAPLEGEREGEGGGWK